MKDEKDISIHALLAESDHTPRRPVVQRVYFYPRSPCGERLCSGAYRPLGSLISIHALLAESDFALRIIRRTFTNFYPRSPCGERLPQWLPWLLQLLISIHALLAESDLADAVQQTGETISIHALLAESDPVKLPQFIRKFDFYPRSPCGERRRRNIPARKADNFYPRSPCGERLVMQLTRNVERSISIHALLAESDTTYW